MMAARTLIGDINGNQKQRRQDNIYTSSSDTLRGADLSGANLYKADLSGANLSEVNLPLTDRVLICRWSICHIQREHIRIGCEYHTTAEWTNFTDEEINNMGINVLDWWRANKSIVLAIARECAAVKNRP